MTHGNRRTTHRWRVVGLGTLAFTFATVLAIAGIAAVRAGEEPVEVPVEVPQAPTGFDPFLHRRNGAIADPINLIFRGADTDRAAAAVEQVLGWRAVAGSGMTFMHDAGPRPTARQYGFNLGGGSRLHLRIETVAPADGQSYVLAAVHRDDSVPCGHVGRAFDDTRDIVARAFQAAGYRVINVPLDNSQSGMHCDGSHLSGDGHAAMIYLTAP